MSHTQLPVGTRIRLADIDFLSEGLRKKEFVTIACPERFIGSAIENEAWIEWHGSQSYIGEKYYSVIKPPKHRNVPPGN